MIYLNRLRWYPFTSCDLIGFDSIQILLSLNIHTHSIYLRSYIYLEQAHKYPFHFIEIFIYKHCEQVCFFVVVLLSTCYFSFNNFHIKTRCTIFTYFFFHLEKAIKRTKQHFHWRLTCRGKLTSQL